MNNGFKSNVRIFVHWLIVTAWCGVIFYLSSRSSIVPQWHFWDQVLSIIGHFGEYSILAFLFYRAVNLSLPALKNVWPYFVYTLIFCAIYAATDEWHQSFVPTRIASVFDWMTDIVGTVCGTAVAVLIYKLYIRE
ncbi:MAG: VanZ family protein [Elusimicrobiota bacterium]